MASAPATARYRPAQLVTALIVTAAWMAALTIVALSFSYAGTAGLVGEATPLRPGTEAALLDGFDLDAGVIALLISLVLVAIVQVIPSTWLSPVLDRFPVQRIAAVIAIALGVVLVLSGVLRFAWWIWIAALLLSLLTRAILALHPEGLSKPWRLSGAAVAVLLFLTWAFQIFGGAELAIIAVVVVNWCAAGLLVIGGVLAVVLRGGAEGGSLPVTGALNVSRRAGTRQPSQVLMPWPCHALFVILGAQLALAQPQVWSLQSGQGGFALIVTLILAGWAIGYELGPSFAPGMSRPRVTAFALLGSGILMIVGAFVQELTAEAIVAGGSAVLVGIGSRSQTYAFSRRMGASVGIVGALILVLAMPGGTLPISPYVELTITPVMVAMLTVGALGAIAGLIAILVFDPRGTMGLGVDMIYAFQPRRETADAERLGQVPERTHDRGAFIVFEGGDGAGKTTQLKRLAAHLVDDRRLDVETTREPGGTETGRRIRSLLLDGTEVAPRPEALLFAADRGQHVERLIGPALQRGHIVISDRYLDSSLAYQSAGRALSGDDVRALSLWSARGLVPHLTILLDLDPEVARERLAERGEADRMEEVDQSFAQRVRQAFLDLARSSRGRHLVIDASRDPEDIAAEIRRAVDGVLQSRRSVLGAADADLQTPLGASESSVVTSAPGQSGTEAPAAGDSFSETVSLTDDAAGFGDADAASGIRPRPIDQDAREIVIGAREEADPVWHDHFETEPVPGLAEEMEAAALAEAEPAEGDEHAGPEPDGSRGHSSSVPEDPDPVSGPHAERGEDDEDEDEVNTVHLVGDAATALLPAAQHPPPAEASAPEGSLTTVLPEEGDGATAVLPVAEEAVGASGDPQSRSPLGRDHSRLIAQARRERDTRERLRREREIDLEDGEE